VPSGVLTVAVGVTAAEVVEAIVEDAFVLDGVMDELEEETHAL
jgi:hypothetical protein